MNGQNAPEPRSAADPEKKSSGFDVFISYSRKDAAFVSLLETTLKRHLPPRGIVKPRRRLRVFRDENDFVGGEYRQAITEHLAASGKLLVICSPHARASRFVDDEIRRFLASNTPANLVPVLCSGLPNNEVAKGQEDQAAFPHPLCEVMEMPLAADFRGLDPAKDRIARGKFEKSWFFLLATIYGVSRELIEAREQRRRRWQRSLQALAVVAALAGAAWWGWTRTDAYQMQSLADSGSVLYSSASEDDLQTDRAARPEWLRALVRSSRLTQARKLAGQDAASLQIVALEAARRGADTAAMQELGWGRQDGVFLTFEDLREAQRPDLADLELDRIEKLTLALPPDQLPLASLIAAAGEYLARGEAQKAGSLAEKVKQAVLEKLGETAPPGNSFLGFDECAAAELLLNVKDMDGAIAISEKLWKTIQGLERSETDESKTWGTPFAQASSSVASITHVLAKAGRRDRAEAIVKEFAQAKAPEDDLMQPEFQRDLAAAYLAAGLLTEALRHGPFSGGDMDPEASLDELQQAGYAPAEIAEAARAAIDFLPAKDRPARRATAFARLGRVEEAEGAAAEVSDPSSRLRAWCSVATQFLKSMRPEAAKRAAMKALEGSSGIRDWDHRNLAVLLAQTGSPKGIEALKQKAADPKLRVETLTSAARDGAVAIPDDLRVAWLETAIETALTIPEQDFSGDYSPFGNRSKALREIAETLSHIGPAGGAARVAMRMTAVARAIENGDHRAYVLVPAAAALLDCRAGPHEAASAAKEANAISLAMNSDETRGKVLGELVRVNVRLKKYRDARLLAQSPRFIQTDRKLHAHAAALSTDATARRK